MLSIRRLNERMSNAPAFRASARGWHRFGAVILLLIGGFISAFPGCKCSPGADCDNLDDVNPCTIDECQDDVAIHTPLSEGTPCIYGKLQGTCQAGGCVIPCESQNDCVDGRPCTNDTCLGGLCQVGPSGSGIVDDGNACTVDLCNDGQPVYPYAPDGTPCGTSGECVQGVCNHCITNEDCGTDTFCRKWECNKGVCVASDWEENLLVSAQDIVGDCVKPVCDGKGYVKTVSDMIDPPLSMDPCFAWYCDGWTPVRTVNVHADCVMDGGGLGVCDEQGECIECLKDGDCKSGQICEQGVCRTCGDPTQNSGTVCGGACGECNAASCDQHSDCASGNCVLTNAVPPDPNPPRVCCNFPCDKVCEQCNATTGSCEPVPAGKPDLDTCNTSTLVCTYGQQCKTKNGQSCSSNVDCASKLCDIGTGKCKGCTSNADCVNSTCDLGTKFCK
jgi:hypothetical protein